MKNKYRAWNTEDGEWVYFWVSQLCDAISLGDTSALPIGDEPLVNYCQWTGLKDKNGKEIYKGDIMTIRDTYGSSYPMAVLWDTDHWTLDDNGCYGTLSEWIDSAMVIGNIYENPDSLN
jgi:hypothetical protein